MHLVYLFVGLSTTQNINNTVNFLGLPGGTKGASSKKITSSKNDKYI